MANRTKLTPKKKRQFLEVLCETANVSEAARQTNVSRTQWYAKRANDEEFAKEWGEALELGTDALEDEAVRRAVEGVDEPIFYQGRRVGMVRRYSDTLLIFLLKARRPDKFRERKEERPMGRDGEPVETPQVRKLDLDKLTDDELDEYERLLKKCFAADSSS